jgi:hypothetical protein
MLTIIMVDVMAPNLCWQTSLVKVLATPAVFTLVPCAVQEQITFILSFDALP